MKERRHTRFNNVLDEGIQGKDVNYFRKELKIYGLKVE